MGRELSDVLRSTIYLIGGGNNSSGVKTSFSMLDFSPPLGFIAQKDITG